MNRCRVAAQTAFIVDDDPNIGWSQSDGNPIWTGLFLQPVS